MQFKAELIKTRADNLKQQEEKKRQKSRELLSNQSKKVKQNYTSVTTPEASPLTMTPRAEISGQEG